MYNTTGDVVLTSISRETQCFHDFALYPKQGFFAFLSLWQNLRMFLNFGIFQPRVFTRKILIRKKECNQSNLSFAISVSLQSKTTI